MNLRSALVLVAALTFIAAAAAAPAAHQTGSIDGSRTVTCKTATMLFGGAVPPNGFFVNSVFPITINDNGPASQTPNSWNMSGIYLPGTSSPGGMGTFVTPQGYAPMGPVTVFAACDGGTVYVAARAW
ncbi:MAG TPA: hypothetical protein VH640_01945 [Bryobacteraceae bacterium]|jgi:hypothetical protein